MDWHINDRSMFISRTFCANCLTGNFRRQLGLMLGLEWILCSLSFKLIFWTVDSYKGFSNNGLEWSELISLMTSRKNLGMVGLKWLRGFFSDIYTFSIVGIRATENSFRSWKFERKIIDHDSWISWNLCGSSRLCSSSTIYLLAFVTYYLRNPYVILAFNYGFCCISLLYKLDSILALLYLSYSVILLASYYWYSYLVLNGFNIFQFYSGFIVYSIMAKFTHAKRLDFVWMF